MSLFPELDHVPGKEPADTPPRKKDSGATDEPPASEAPAAGRAAPPPVAYLALARKYRPNAFDEVIGQAAVTSTLKNAIASGRLHHAYLFSGIRGVGKTTVARLFARALNCAQGPTQDPCGECDACREIASGLSMDVIEIDAASNRGVDDVEPLREAARYAPSRDRYKVFILDEVHMLSNAAFNSLLKILEEPPPRIVWMLATTEYRKIPPTVVSRCQHFEFRRVAREEVTAYLARIATAEKAEVSARGLDMIAAAAGGSVRDAVSILDQVIAYTGAHASDDDVARAIGLVDRRHLLAFLKHVTHRDAPALLDLIADLAEAGTDFSQFAAGLVTAVRDAALVRFAAEGSRALHGIGYEARDLEQIASALGEDALLRVFNAVLDLPGQLRGAPQPRFALEAAALRLARMAEMTPIEEIIGRLSGSGGPAAPAPGSGGPPPAATNGGTKARPQASEPAPPRAGSASPAPEEASARDDEQPLREKFLAAVQQRKLSLRTFLEGARSLEWTDGSLRIEMGRSQTFFRQGLESPDNLGLIKEAAEEVAGRPVEVAVVVEESGAPASEPPAAGPSGAGKRDRLIQEALARPGVKMVMEAFSGRIVDIREKNQL